MRTSIHNCCRLITATKAGGLKDIRPCNKIASVKSRSGEGYLCAEHALEESRGKEIARASR